MHLIDLGRFAVFRKKTIASSPPRDAIRSPAMQPTPYPTVIRSLFHHLTLVLTTRPRKLSLPRRLWPSDGKWGVCLGTLAIFIGGMGANPVAAQLSSETRESLLADIAQARQQLDPSRLPDLTTRSQAVLEQFREVDDYLNLTADAENREGWMEYLNVDPLQQAIAEEADPGMRGQLAQDLYFRMARNLPGLERGPLIRLRRAAKQLLMTAKLRDQQDLIRRIDRVLERLAEIVQQSDTALSPETASQLNYILNYLDASNQAPQLVERVRVNIGSPNLRVAIGAGRVARMVTRPVLEVGPSDECILGTRVISQTELKGLVTATLLPSADSARFLINLDAQFSSLGTGYNRGVRVRNRSFGNVHAVRPLWIDADGVDLGPVSTTADLDSQILGIQHPLRIVRRIAAKTAARQRSQTNAIAESRLENRVTKQFGEASEGKVSRGNLLPQAAVADVLTRLDLDQPTKHWSSNTDYLQLRLTATNARQTTTAVAPPEIVPGFDVVVQVHESAINNPATFLLAERFLGDGEIRQFLLGLIPADLKVAGVAARDLPLEVGAAPAARALELGQALLDGELPDSAAEIVDSAADIVKSDAESDEQSDEKIGITFDAQRPLIFEARDGVLTVGIVGTQFRRDENELNRRMRISATFKPVRQEDGSVRLDRVGDLLVTFPNSSDRGLSIAERTIVTAIRRRLTRVFPEQLMEVPFDMAGPIANMGDGKPLRAVAISPRDGWLTVYLQ
jgi:hypothetical protein